MDDEQLRKLGEAGTNATGSAEVEPSAGGFDLGLLTRPELPEGFLTDDELERQEREAAELHAQAVALRSMLDAPPTLLPEQPRSRRRRVSPVLLLLVVVLVIAGIVWVRAGDDSAAPSTPAGSRSPGVTGQADPNASPTNPGVDPVQTLSAELQALARLGLPISGVGIDRPGTAVSVHLVSETIQIDDRILLPEPTSDDITLMLPPTTMLTGDPADLRPALTGLKVSAGGRPLKVTRHGDRWTVHPTSGKPVGALLVQYRTTDAIATSQPSTKGRALGLVLPLVTEADGPVVVVAHSSEVSGIVCPGAQAALQLCGRSATGGDAWTAAMNPGLASRAVLLQLDLNR